MHKKSIALELPFLIPISFVTTCLWYTPISYNTRESSLRATFSSKGLCNNGCRTIKLWSRNSFLKTPRSKTTCYIKTAKTWPYVSILLRLKSEQRWYLLVSICVIGFSKTRHFSQFSRKKSMKQASNIIVKWIPFWYF